MSKKTVAVILTAFVICAFSLVTNDIYAAEDDKSNSKDIINKGVYIAGTDVSGLTTDEAEKLVKKEVSDMKSSDVTLKIGDTAKTVSASDIGVEWINEDVVEDAYEVGRTGNIVYRYKTIKNLEKDSTSLNLEFSANTELISKIIKAESEEFNCEAVDMSLTRENGEFVVIDGKQGIEIDTAKSIAAVEDFFKDKWNKDNTTVELVAEITEPKGNREDLEKVKDVLGSYNTYCGGPGTGRVQNITNGTSKINGSVVYPGEEFSANAAMEPYNEETGYALGGSYENGEVVQTYGGGICQVSTTLYNALLYSELEITDRAPHSLQVSYVDPSKDAAIAGEWKDLKFKNTSDAPVYIEGYLSGGSLYFTIYGHETRPANRTIEFESVTTGTTPSSVSLEATGDAFGSIYQSTSGHSGLTAQLFKIVYEDGKQVSRTQVNSSSYQMTPTVVCVGTAYDNAEAVAALNAAIASNDQGACEAVIAQYQAEEAEKQAEEEAKAAEEAAKAEEEAKKQEEKEDNKKKDEENSDSKKDDSADKDNKKDDSTANDAQGADEAADDDAGDAEASE